MIRINIDKSELNDIYKLMSYVKIALEKHENDQRKAFAVKKEYYDGKKPKFEYVINKSKYIVDMATEVFIGTQPDVTTNSKKQSERNRLINLNKKLKVRHFDKVAFEVGLNASKLGVGYWLTYTEAGDDFPRFVSLDPLVTNVVFDCSVNPNSLFGFTYALQTEYIGNTEKEYYKVFVYTDEKLIEMRTASINDLSISRLYREVPHFLSRVPITEIGNNEEHKGDAEPVFELISAYNKLQNNRLQNVDDVLKYVLMLKNVRIGNEDDQKKFVDLLKNQNVLSLEGDGVDAKFLTNPLDQNQLQTLANDFEKLIHEISRVPNLTADAFAMNSSEPALKLKLKGFLDLAKEKERLFTPALMRILKMVLSFIDRRGDTKYSFDIEEIELKYSHTLPSNDQEMITQIMNLKNSGLLNPRIALQNISWIENVDAYIDGMIVEEPPQANNGVNATNLERQNGVPQEESQKDNLNNFNQGNAQKISE